MVVGDHPAYRKFVVPQRFYCDEPNLVGRQPFLFPLVVVVVVPHRRGKVRRYRAVYVGLLRAPLVPLPPQLVRLVVAPRTVRLEPAFLFAFVVAVPFARVHQFPLVRPLPQKLTLGNEQLVRVVVALKVRLVARLLPLVAYVVARFAAPPLRLAPFVFVAPLWRLVGVVVELKIFRHVVQK